MRKTTIQYPAAYPTAPPLATAEPVKPPERPPAVDRTQVTTPAWAALLAGGFALLSVAGVSWPAAVWAIRGDPPNFDLISGLIFAPLIIGLVVGGLTGVYVTTVAAHNLRPRLAPQPEPAPQMMINIPPAPDVQDDEPAEAAPISPDVAELFMTGLNILAYHYVDGQAATRAECENALGIDQGTWNNINRILRGLRIKAERSWMTDVSYQRARALWLQCGWSTADLSSDRPSIFIPSPTGGFERVDLTVNQP